MAASISLTGVRIHDVNRAIAEQSLTLMIPPSAKILNWVDILTICTQQKKSPKYQRKGEVSNPDSPGAHHGNLPFNNSEVPGWDKGMAIMQSTGIDEVDPAHQRGINEGRRRERGGKRSGHEDFKQCGITPPPSDAGPAHAGPACDLTLPVNPPTV